MSSEAASSSKDCYGDPPQLLYDLPSSSGIQTTGKETNLPVDILLLTVENDEFLACHQQLKNPCRWWFDDLGYVYFEEEDESQKEKVKIALLKCCGGSGGPGSSLISVKNAVTVLRPKAVISVGACSGLNPEKTKLGDVIVSSRLSTYASKVVMSDQEQSTGLRTYVSKHFLNVIKNCADGWQAPLKNPKASQALVEVHCGEILSGPEQIQAECRRDQLAKCNLMAMAVEMEGEGVFTAAFDSGIEWLIVKGIADYAGSSSTQQNAKSWRRCASVMAASLVMHILSNPTVFCSWPHYKERVTGIKRSPECVEVEGSVKSLKSDVADVQLRLTQVEEKQSSAEPQIIPGSSSVSKSTQEKTNYSRLCRLLISIGSRVLRDTFDSIIPPENLRELVLKRDPAHSRLKLLRKKGVLTSVHWSKLYPATPTEVSSASFDIPFLVVLLRTICNLSPPPAGWDTPPLTADTSRESDIARIKYFMNAVSKHAAEGSFSDAVFNSYWQQICDTLVRLGGADYGVVINEMKDQDIEFLDGEHFRELLKQWKKVEDDIKEKLNELETEEASMEEAWNVFPSLQNLRCDTEQVSKKTNLPSDLRTIAANKGFLVSVNQASGNCLFYALSEQLQSVNGIQISHKELRKTLVQFLDENPNLHEGTSLFNFVSGYSSWREYLQSMAKDGNWGDHVVLFAAANRFQTPIRIISSLDHEIVVHPDHALANSSPLVLGHIHELHYVSLQPRQGSSSVLKSSQGELNYSRLCLLLISTGSRVLRDTFDSIIPPENLRELLKRDPAHSRLQLLRKKGVLTSVHWRRLYPATPTEVSSASFDIPLLIVLLRTICNLRPPPAGWDTAPLTADTSRESDIARIKYFVNAVSKHATEGSVSDAVFSSYWQQICNTLVRLGGADYEDLIDEFKDQEIEFLDEEHFRELLKQWKKVEDDIRDRLNEVESEEAAKEKDPGKASSASGPVGPGVDGPSDLTKQVVHDQGLGLSFPTDLIEKIRQLYKTRERRLLPVPWLDDFSFHINDIFTRLKILGKEKTQGVLTNDITNMTAIFKAHAECQRPRTVLIEGDPGMGKTTYCQKLAYDWATKQEKWDPSFPEIEVLLLLKCHEIKSDIWEAIDDQILPEEMDTQAKECFFKFIRENQSKVLLVLDGLDEADTSNIKMFSNLIESKELSGCYIVLTSRHEAGKNARRYCDTLWEIVGFTQYDAESFILKYFKNVNKEHLAMKLIKMLWRFTGQAKDLRDLTKNPLNTSLLCVIWEDLKGVLPTSRTELYIDIVLFVLERYEQKQGLSSENEDLLSVYNKDLIYLGRMALESLQNGELCFEEHKSDCHCIVLSKMGFLSLQPALSKRRVRTRYAFLHKSFQEFFSGFFLACKLIKGKISCESLVTDQRYESELYQVFVFLIGILVSKRKETAESVVKSLAANINFTSLKLDKDAAKYVSKRVSFALTSLSEQASLLQTLGEHLNFTQLNLRNCQIGDSRTASLSQALAVNPSLTNLDLSGNGIGDSGAASLSKALAVNSSLTNLDLSGNGIGDSGAASFSKVLQANTSLTELYLSRKRIGASGAASLSQALAVNSLTNLDLSGNRIGDSGAASLSKALAVNSSLTELDLSRNFICDSGAISLFEALAVNSSLTNLDLTENSFDESCPPWRGFSFSGLCRVRYTLKPCVEDEAPEDTEEEE